MEHTWKNVIKTPNVESISNFIGSIKDKYLENYPAFQSAKRVRELAPDKEYARRWYIKKAKFEFVEDLMKKLQAHPKGSTEWGQEKLQFLQRVKEQIKLSMNSDAAFATEEKKRKALKQEEEAREQRRLNTWV